MPASHRTGDSTLSATWRPSIASSRPVSHSAGGLVVSIRLEEPTIEPIVIAATAPTVKASTTMITVLPIERPIGCNCTCALIPISSLVRTTLRVAHERARARCAALPFSRVVHHVGASGRSEMTTSEVVSSDGVKLAVRDLGGRGRALLLVHGLASSSHIFDLVAPRLLEDFHVVAYDQRGHGESGKP